MEKDKLYSRNALYIDSIEQEEIKKCRIVIAGAGLGGNIAECALRLGFENILIVDGDRVEQSNLNRQNYLFPDIGKYKAEVIYQRLKDINPGANIQYETVFIDENNLHKYIINKDIAINTMDFTSQTPFLFDDCCVKKQVPVLRVGWFCLCCQR
ncbi:MAG: ThiF family adenylyltransferase [Prevotella sp.]|jgi:tRNA A37 threonylcarbamoyladenosine dehydratase|nr:ThiF family adenylyltransferase [Prevotella sp.]